MGSHGEGSLDTLDVAVIGLACRFPGGASTSSRFWDLLHQRKSAYTEVPRERYNVDAFHHGGGDKLNTLRNRGGHFLDEDVTTFDAPFFSITSNEAKGMDPTARMLLEVTYEALENAGLPIEDLVGTNTSCYVGCFTRDFHEMLMRDAETSPMYAGTGTGFSLLSNRISWFYDFRGPSLTLDTACSSSLVGLHLACQGLRSGESKLAVVSGANLILSPDLAMWLSNLHMLSQDGLSRSFAEGTTGYGRGEGIATLILKPLADALRDGDCVRAVIRGTGVNQDGHTKGITVPNSDAQADLIRSTYLSAGLDFSQTAYFEAHGTGTAVGDPLELAAVARTLGSTASPERQLFVGSVKSNVHLLDRPICVSEDSADREIQIGHLEGAAGLAGVIKCILMLETGKILPNIHFDKPNRRIPFGDWNISVPTSVLPWPLNRLRRVSVNSFGYGGTNAHAIIDDAGEYLAKRGLQDPKTFPMMASRSVERQRLFVFSARTEAAIDRLKKQYSQHLESLLAASHPSGEFDEATYLDRLAFTLSERRSSFDWKIFLVASSIEELKEDLLSSTLQATRPSSRPRITFVFTGQGAQWARMGLQLLKYPVFKKSVLEAEDYLGKMLGCKWSVMEELERDEITTNIQFAKISQPVCTILQVALVDLLDSWSVKPAGTVGHSSGEIGAAYAYGAISREDAWMISYHRGKLCSELSSEVPQLKGSMMAVGCTRADAENYVAGVTQGKLVVACVNSPESITISGDEAAIDELLETLKARSVFARKLKVENAYHSHHMKLIAERYLASIASMRTRNPPSAQNLVMVSSVTGTVVKHSDLDPEYWVKNLVSPVLFSDAVKTLVQHNTQRKRRVRAGEPTTDFLLEVGPHAALQGPLRQIFKHQNISTFTYKSVILRGKDAGKTAIDAAGTLYSHGAPVSILDISGIQNMLAPLVDLPSYPWNHSLKYWSESSISRNYRFREHGRHDLLGSPAMGFDQSQPKWRNFLRVSENPWIRDHVVQSSILYPGAGIIAIPIEAVKQLADKKKIIENIQLRDVRINKAIVVPDDQYGIECFLQMRRQRHGANGSWTGWWEFSVSTCLEDREPEENGSGMIAIQYKSDNDNSWTRGKGFTTEALKQEYQDSMEACKIDIRPEDFYQATEQAGLKYGPLFQGLTKISIGKNRCCCTISIPDTKRVMPANVESPHLIHPTTLDIIFHSLFAALGNGELDFANAAVPISFDSLIISADLPTGAGSKFSGFCQARRDRPREIVADIYMSDVSWEEPKVRIKGIRCRELPGSGGTSSSSAAMKAPCGTLTWKPDIDFCDEKGLNNYLSAIEGGSIERSETRLLQLLEISACKAIDLLAHQNPDLEILQIGGSGSGLTASILSVLATSPDTTARFKKVTVADSNLSHMDSFMTAFQAWQPRVTFTALRMDLDLEEQGWEAMSFDVIIVAPDLSTYAKADTYLTLLQDLLREQGKLIFLESQNNAPTIRWAESFMEIEPKPLPGKQLVKMSIGEGPQKQILSISTKPIVEEDAEVLETIYILQPADPSSRVVDVSKSIVRNLSSLRLPAEIVRWPPKTEALKAKPILSLLEMDSSFLTNINASEFELLKKIVLQSLTFLWTSMGDDPVMGAGMGYLRVLKNENPNLQLRFLLAEDNSDRSSEDLASVIVRAAIGPSIDREFVEIDGHLCISRWTPDNGTSRMFASVDSADQREHMALEESQRTLELVTGNFERPESFYYTVKSDSVGELAADEVEIEVKAMTINPNNNATPVEQTSRSTAKDFSGIVKAVGKSCSTLRVGDRVFACGLDAYETMCRTTESLCQHIPGDMTFEEAASWPLAFGIAYQSLFGTRSLQKGQSLLVQAAAGAVGQVAIQLGQSCGALVYATVSSEAESSIVEGHEIPKDSILNDNDPDLAETIATVTGGKGFDVILNASKQGDALRQLWHSVAPHGSLVNFDKANASDKSAMDMRPFEKGCSFTFVDIDSIIRDRPSLMAEMLQYFTKLVANNSIGSVNPLTLFSADSIADAFRFAHEHRNTGKVVVTYKPQDRIPILPSARNPLALSSNATYILAGGLGGLGRSLARLLVANGARNIVLLSRSGPKSPNAQALVQEISALGVVTRVYACDISDEGAMKKIITQCDTDMPPIRGVIQAAAVLNDSIYDNMTHELWRGAIRPKVHGSWLLHKLLPKDMDFFVMLSSIAGVVGNRSQANYAAGNTYQDNLARYRRAHGLPAVSVDLGLMVGIGLIAERGGFTNLRKSEAVALEEPDLHTILKVAMAGSYGEALVPAQLITGLPTGGILEREGLDAPFYFDDPRFLLMKKVGLNDSANGDDTDGENGSSKSKALETQLAACVSLPEAARLISNALCVKLAKDLQTSPENIDSSKPLHTYGVDSLMAVEIRAWILQRLQSEITLFDVLSGASIAVLATKIAASSKLVPRGLDTSAKRGSLEFFSLRRVSVA